MGDAPSPLFSSVQVEVLSGPAGLHLRRTRWRPEGPRRIPQLFEALLPLPDEGPEGYRGTLNWDREGVAQGISTTR
ncbi:MAG: hypothetical protein AB7J34_25745 [Limisphaerales bacterium]